MRKNVQCFEEEKWVVTYTPERLMESNEGDWGREDGLKEFSKRIPEGRILHWLKTSGV